jgi:hypothetical protein
MSYLPVCIAALLLNIWFADLTVARAKDYKTCDRPTYRQYKL